MKNVIFIFILSAVALFPQDAGNSGLSFLKIGVGAKNMALGDAGTAFSSGAASVFYNPAKLNSDQFTEIFASHNAWIQDVRSEAVGVKTNLFGLPWGLGFNITSINDIEIRHIAEADPEGTFNAHYFSGSLSTAFDLFDNLRTGITLKYLYEGLYTDEAAGWGFDIGFVYSNLIKNLDINAAVKNIGGMSKLKNEKTKLPSELRVGPSYTYCLSDSNFTFTGSVEYQKYFDDKKNNVNAGLEVNYDNFLSLRGGYQSGLDSRSFTTGMGIKWNNINIDYAFVPFKYSLGSANTISLTVKF